MPYWPVVLASDEELNVSGAVELGDGSGFGALAGGTGGVEVAAFD